MKGYIIMLDIIFWAIMLYIFWEYAKSEDNKDKNAS